MTAILTKGFPDSSIGKNLPAMQFSSVQLLSHVRLFATPWIAAHQASLSISYHFAFSYCSWGSQGTTTEVACHSLLQWTTFCQISPPWPTRLGLPRRHGLVSLRRPQFDSWVGKIHWRRGRLPTLVFLGFPCGSAGKESACNAGDLGSIPGLGRSPGAGKGYPLQYSGLENSMDCIVHGVAKSQTWLIDFHFTSF